MCFSGAVALRPARFALFPVWPALPYAQRMATKPVAAATKRPRLMTRSNVLPALGIGLITAILAVQEHASFVIGIVVGLAVAGVIIGMIAVKRAFYGD